MARSLSSLRQRNDYNGKQIRCLIIEDSTSGLLSKVREPELFKDLIEQTPASLLTIVFEPTEADRTKLLKLIGQNINPNGESLDVTIGEEDVLLTLLEMTDLELNPIELKANRQLMTEILAQPSALFISIKNELDMILIEVIKSFEEVVNAYRHMPSEMLDATNQLLELQKEEEENNKKIETKKQEIEHLKQRLAELEGDMGENVH